jgi:predicted nucleic acid-binding Zn ribbon protein
MGRMRKGYRQKGLEGMVEQPERYCSYCGQELRPEDQFCSNCGMPVHRAARVPTPKADRAVPPLPPPTQQVGRRRGWPGRGRKLVVILVLVVLVLYLVLPLVIESLIAWRLQTAFGTPTKPDVEVSSNFPPMMLLGRMDRVQVTMDQASLQGVAVYNAQADLKDVKVSVPNLLEGNPTIETQSCSLSTETPPIFIDQNQACLNYLGFGAGY